VKFEVPQKNLIFDIPDDWWESAGMVGYATKLSHYSTDPKYEIVVIEDIEPPVRDIGLRNEETVIKMLRGMRNNEEFPPIEVNKEKNPSGKYIVYDGYHRFYLSIAMGYTKIPIKEKFDLKAFFEAEDNYSN
jgi:hypothetical protein